MALTKGIIFKRLQSAKNLQQSVETMSAWILHHVKYISTISRVWFDVYVGANDELKITLIYIMNDVLQKSRKLHGDLPQKICTTFYFHLRYCILISSDPVKQKIRRVAGILATRHVISKSREEELNDLLDGKIVRIFPPDLKTLGVEQPSTSDSAKVVRHDKYINLIRSLIQEEGILPQNSLSNEGDRPPLLSKKEGTNQLLSLIPDVSGGAHNVESVGENFRVFEYVDAVQKAEKDGKQGPFNPEDLGLTDSRDDFYTVNTTVPKSMEKCDYKSMKQIRSLEIKHLKGELAAADTLSTRSSNKNVSQSTRDSTSSSDSLQHSKLQQGHSEQYSPPVVAPPIKKSRFSTDSIPQSSSMSSRQSSREFLDSIPLPDPIPVSEIPLPAQQPPPLMYKPSLSADEAPPGVDDPSNDMSIVLPAPLQYADPMQMYSPTFPQFSGSQSPQEPKTYSQSEKPAQVSSSRRSRHSFDRHHDDRYYDRNYHHNNDYRPRNGHYRSRY